MTSAEAAVEAIQKGASDYLTKPIDLGRLRERIGRSVEAGQQRRKAERLDDESLETCQFEGITSRSPAMQDVFTSIRRVAPYFRNVLITGPHWRRERTGSQGASPVESRTRRESFPGLQLRRASRDSD